MRHRCVQLIDTEKDLIEVRARRLAGIVSLCQRVS